MQDRQATMQPTTTQDGAGRTISIGIAAPVGDRPAGDRATGGRAATAARLERAESVLVALVALHSVVVGLLLTFAPAWGARFGGFGVVSPLFFPRQAGAFHFVVAIVYLVEYFHYRGVSLLLLTKAIAIAFLGLSALQPAAPWLVVLSGLGDAAMAGAVLALRHARRLPLLGPPAPRP